MDKQNKVLKKLKHISKVTDGAGDAQAQKATTTTAFLSLIITRFL